jgi:hypothetical protein
VGIACAVLGGVIGLLLFAVVRLQMKRRAGFDTPLLHAFCADFGVPPTNQALRLMGRYLQRSDRFRQAWTWIGIAASIGLSFVWRPPSGPTWGLIVFPPTSNVFLMALGFWFVGLVRSEMYNLRPRFNGPRLASLEVRGVRHYLPRRMVVLPRVTALLAVGLVVANQVLPRPSPHRSVVVVLGVLACVTLLVTEACQLGIAQRARPAVSSDIRAADEAIRRMASWSIAYGGAGLITLLAAFEAILVSVAPLQAPAYQFHPGSDQSTLGVLVTPYGPRSLFLALSFVLFFWAVGLALQARRMVQPDQRTRGRAAAAMLR